MPRDLARGTKSEVNRGWHRNLQRADKALDSDTELSRSSAEQYHIIIGLVPNRAEEHVDCHEHAGREGHKLGELHREELGRRNLVLDLDGRGRDLSLL